MVGMTVITQAYRNKGVSMEIQCPARADNKEESAARKDLAIATVSSMATLPIVRSRRGGKELMAFVNNNVQVITTCCCYCCCRPPTMALTWECTSTPNQRSSGSGDEAGAKSGSEIMEL